MAPPDGEIISKTTENTLPASDFPRFDVISDEPSDHAYFKATKPAASTNVSSGVNKKIMQEWRVLDSNLPDSIFVRVYETRITLLRAAIVGAPGTPYHDGLFFFDICLPSDYPSHPPLVCYRSFGFRINPNLYESGRVCLSLLNTWSGNKSEKWDRNRSTILQVLLSIQALVLNEKPYFNEPGLGGSRGKKFWEKKSMEYSQDVFILSCKSALCLLRRPPTNFEALVTSHFRDRSAEILTACVAYRSGLTRVGRHVPGAGGGPKIELSNRFKGMLDKVYGDLVDAFAKNGGPVDQFVKQLASERAAKAKADAKKKEEKVMKKMKARSAIKKRLIGIWDKIWFGTGLKNPSSTGNDDQLVKAPLV